LLKRGLESEHALVRFAAAESLAYLGSPAGGEELARLAREQPPLRAYCLTAMASLDEVVSHVKLAEMLSCPSPEARYRAFRALYTLDANDSHLRGELLNDSFWLHQVAPDAAPMAHVSTSRRPELVLFGGDAVLAPPFTVLAGPEFTVTASPGDDKCTVSR